MKVPYNLGVYLPADQGLQYLSQNSFDATFQVESGALRVGSIKTKVTFKPSRFADFWSLSFEGMEFTLANGSVLEALNSSCLPNCKTITEQALSAALKDAITRVPLVSSDLSEEELSEFSMGDAPVVRGGDEGKSSESEERKEEKR